MVVVEDGNSSPRRLENNLLGLLAANDRFGGDSRPRRNVHVACHGGPPTRPFTKAPPPCSDPPSCSRKDPRGPPCAPPPGPPQAFLSPSAGRIAPPHVPRLLAPPL